MAAPNELSFLPDDYLERKARRRTNFFCATLLVAIAGGVAVAFTKCEKNTGELAKEHDRIEASYNIAAQRITQVREMQEKQRTMARQAELTASLLEKVPRTYLLAEITNALPAGVSLMDLTLDSKLITAATPVAAGKSAYEQKKAEMEAAKVASLGTAAPKRYDVFLKVTGMAGTDVHVAQFLSRLSRSKLFTDVNLVISDEYQQKDTKLRKFQVEMRVNPEAEVRPATVRTRSDGAGSGDTGSAASSTGNGQEAP